MNDGDALAALQAELAFQGETVAALNDALAAQQQDILLMKRQLKLLADEVRRQRDSEADATARSSANEPPPPHY